MIYPVGSEIPSLINAPPTILNGGTAYQLLQMIGWILRLDEK